MQSVNHQTTLFKYASTTTVAHGNRGKLEVSHKALQNAELHIFPSTAQHILNPQEQLNIHVHVYIPTVILTIKIQMS